jgi:hypothetical protein
MLILIRIDFEENLRKILIVSGSRESAYLIREGRRRGSLCPWGASKEKAGTTAGSVLPRTTICRTALRKAVG